MNAVKIQETKFELNMQTHGVTRVLPGLCPLTRLGACEQPDIIRNNTTVLNW